MKIHDRARCQQLSQWGVLQALLQLLCCAMLHCAGRSRAVLRAVYSLFLPRTAWQCVPEVSLIQHDHVDLISQAVFVCVCRSWQHVADLQDTTSQTACWDSKTDCSVWHHAISHKGAVAVTRTGRSHNTTNQQLQTQLHGPNLQMTCAADLQTVACAASGAVRCFSYAIKEYVLYYIFGWVPACTRRQVCSLISS